MKTTEQKLRRLESKLEELFKNESLKKRFVMNHFSMEETKEKLGDRSLFLEEPSIILPFSVILGSKLKREESPWSFYANYIITAYDFVRELKTPELYRELIKYLPKLIELVCTKEFDSEVKKVYSNAEQFLTRINRLDSEIEKEKNLMVRKRN
jgi:hypothetical protein